MHNRYHEPQTWRESSGSSEVDSDDEGRRREHAFATDDEIVVGRQVKQRLETSEYDSTSEEEMSEYDFTSSEERAGSSVPEVRLRIYLGLHFPTELPWTVGELAS